MINEQSIASLTISYNSSETLRAQLIVLLRQTRPIDEVIVVDNGSHDSTIAMLTIEFPQVTLIALPENEGIGAALTAGLTYAALKRKHDWTWILDHDSIPEADALAKLLQASVSIPKELGKLGILSSLPSHEDGTHSPGFLWRGRLVLPSIKERQQSYWMVDATISSGSLIHQSVVRDVGFPRADFFIDFVDFEYCLRIRRRGYMIFMVGDSVLHHTVGIPRRFRICGLSKVWSDHAPWREYYYSRNLAYLVWQTFPDPKSKLFVLMVQLRHGAAVLLFGKNPAESLRMLVLGFLDGRAGRLANRFLPERKTESEINPKKVVNYEKAIGK